MNLYWVETDDHDEDWFVIARNSRQAAKFHETAEGYLRGDATATRLVRVPAGVADEVGWPSHEQLESCGARIMREESPRVVEVCGRVFCEGLLEEQIRQVADDHFEANGQGRPNRTRGGGPPS